MKKDRMFQYAYDNGIHTEGISMSRVKIVEDTGLITEEEANNLWQKYYPDVIEKLQEDQRPQMVIWKDCDSEIDYHTEEKSIYYGDDLEIKNGKIYKIKKEIIEL